MLNDFYLLHFSFSEIYQFYEVCYGLIYVFIVFFCISCSDYLPLIVIMIFESCFCILHFLFISHLHPVCKKTLESYTYDCSYFPIQTLVKRILFIYIYRERLNGWTTFDCSIPEEIINFDIVIVLVIGLNMK